MNGFSMFWSSTKDESHQSIAPCCIALIHDESVYCFDGMICHDDSLLDKHLKNNKSQASQNNVTHLAHRNDHKIPCTNSYNSLVKELDDEVGGNGDRGWRDGKWRDEEEL